MRHEDSHFDLILIDFDGTLCATRPAIVHCMKSTLAAMTSRQLSDEAIVATIERGLGLEDSFRVLAAEDIGTDPGLLPRLVAAYRELYAVEAERRTLLFPHWQESLRAIAALGVKTVVVSNKGLRAVNAALERFALDSLVSLVVGDQPGMPLKPDAALFERIIRPAFPAVSRDRTLVVGDTDADIVFARNIGGRSCWAEYGYGRRDICMALEPQFTIQSPSELAAIVGLIS